MHKESWHDTCVLRYKIQQQSLRIRIRYDGRHKEWSRIKCMYILNVSSDMIKKGMI